MAGSSPASVDGRAPVEESRTEGAPPAAMGGLAAARAWIRANLFGSWFAGAVTVVLVYLLARLGRALFAWGVLHAVWSVPHGPAGPDTTRCVAAQGVGACWAVIGEKYRFILFGRFPYAQQWRPALVVLLFVALYAVSGWRRCWRWQLGIVWALALAAILALMWGGFAGLPFVPDEQWGGLPVTLMLATFGLACAFPLAVLIALGRRANSLPAVRLLCIVYVELVRGVPLISLLFMASVMFPLFMPPGLDPPKLMRAQVAFILFAAAYLAEVVRAGLQALPRGQYEAAEALGLGYWQRTALIILPQALRLVIPPLVNTFIGFFKDTSLVLIIGIFDLLTAGRIAVAEPAWQDFAGEVYIVLAAIYFLFCFAMSRYSRGLERRFAAARP